MAVNNLAGLKFRKMSGAGNDFIMIDNREQKLTIEVLRKLAAGLCPRGMAVGADGLIALKPASRVDDKFGKLDFAWDFFNSDGSSAEMCGNGSRCAARFAKDLGLAGDSQLFDTIAGPIRAWIIAEDQVRIGMTVPFDFYFDVKLKAEGQTFTVMGANTGVPHAVVVVPDIENIPLESWGRALRFHEHFAPAGTNVNFVQQVGDKILMRTYERGVEGETLACGTGAVASALTMAIKNRLASPVAVRVRSGKVLQISFTSPDNNKTFSEIYMEGPANYIYDGALSDDMATALL